MVSKRPALFTYNFVYAYSVLVDVTPPIKRGVLGESMSRTELSGIERVDKPN